MANDLIWPRLIYRGHQDKLGLGTHANEAGELVGETKRCESAEQFEEEQKNGWRLTSHLEEAKPAKAEKADAKADAKDKK